MRRVLHVFANLDLGGAESRIVDIYRCVDKKKCQFDFLILTNESCFFEEEVLALGGNIYRVTHPTKNIFKHIKEVFSIFKEEEFYAVHSHTSYFSGLIVLIAWLCRIPFRISHARNQRVGTRRIMTMPLFWVGRLLCNVFSTSKLAISKDAGRFLFGDNGNFIVIPNSFDYAKIKFQRSSDDLGLSNDALNLVMVARLVPVKNHVFAIMLVKKFNENKSEKVKLHLIGSGSEEGDLVKLVERLGVQDDIVFLGRRTDVHDVLCEFDCLILPSLSEGLGVAVLEGQAAGIPCVVSEGVPEEADLGLGLVKRLPLDLELWVKVISDLEWNQNLNKKTINNIFLEKGYSVRKTSEIYLSKYGIDV